MQDGGPDMAPTQVSADSQIRVRAGNTRMAPTKVSADSQIRVRLGNLRMAPTKSFRRFPDTHANWESTHDLDKSYRRFADTRESR